MDQIHESCSLWSYSQLGPGPAVGGSVPASPQPINTRSSPIQAVGFLLQRVFFVWRSLVVFYRMMYFLPVVLGLLAAPFVFLSSS